MQGLRDHASIDIKLIFRGGILPSINPPAHERTLTGYREKQQSARRLVVSPSSVLLDSYVLSCGQNNRRQRRGVPEFLLHDDSRRIERNEVLARRSIRIFVGRDATGAQERSGGEYDRGRDVVHGSPVLTNQWHCDFADL